MKVVVPLLAAYHAGRPSGRCPTDSAVEAALTIAERFADATITVAAFDESHAGLLTLALAAGSDQAVMYRAPAGSTCIPYCAAIAALTATEKPDLLLLPSESDVFHESLASTLDMPIVPNVVSIEHLTATSVEVTAREGGLMAAYNVTLPAILAMDEGAFPMRAVSVNQVVALDSLSAIERVAETLAIPGGPTHTSQMDRGTCEFVKDAPHLAKVIMSHMPPTTMDIERVAGRTGRVVRLSCRVAGERPPLAAARVVVGGGRAFDDPEAFEREIGRLADILGAAVAGTGAAAASTLVPSTSVVGQSRLSIAPHLYIAAGISGVDQHIGGLVGAHTIAAIDRNPHAPIFDRANFGLVADIHAALPEIIAALGDKYA